MADYTILHDSGRVKIIKWTLTSADPTGQAYFNAGHFPDKTLQVFGTFGGSTVILQGSNEIVAATDSHTLNDVTDTAISITSAALKQVLENTHQITPSLSGGSGATVTVLAFLSVAHR